MNPAAAIHQFAGDCLNMNPSHRYSGLGQGVGNAASACKPDIRDVSPVESALDLLNANIGEALREASELVERLSPVSDCGALTGSGSGSESACSPSVSRVESRIADANRGVNALIDLIRSARLGLRI